MIVCLIINSGPRHESERKGVDECAPGVYILCR